MLCANAGMARFNASMQSAHRQYGQDFERAYQQLFSMSPQNELAQALVKQVTTAHDPGEKLMELADNSIVRGLNDGNPPPFMPRNPNTHSRPLSYRDIESTDSGYGDADTEDAIFKAAIG